MPHVPGPDLDVAYLAALGPASNDLPLLARRLLAACDGRRSGAESCERAGIPAPHQTAVLGKLLALGLLEPAFVSAFSTEEEAFFAAEVADLSFDEEERARWRLRDAIGERLLGLFALDEGGAAVGRG